MEGSVSPLMTDEEAEVSPRVTEPRPEWNSSFLTGGLVIWGEPTILSSYRGGWNLNQIKRNSAVVGAPGPDPVGEVHDLSSFRSSTPQLKVT